MELLSIELEHFRMYQHVKLSNLGLMNGRCHNRYQAFTAPIKDLVVVEPNVCEVLIQLFDLSQKTPERNITINKYHPTLHTVPSDI